uniref:Gustatory receptor n=1 Tax=Rhipicephalus appendiculatus TaxID=34631 RepID=A0A131YX73_RHIAP
MEIPYGGENISGDRMTRNIQNVATKASFTQAGDSYMQQMQFLCDTIDPQGMRLSGAEFFSLHRSLLISIAGSVTTYTVILVQTNDDISSRTSTSMVNTRT